MSQTLDSGQSGNISAVPKLATRLLGRTGREVTTLGLGGQAALMLTPPGVDPVLIIEKAYHLGLTYFDTSNAYGPSQSNLGKAFRRLALLPGAPGYEERRARVYIASKTHMRTTRHPAGEKWRNDYSDGADVTTAQDDVRRSLSLLFGDGNGEYPPGTYLDCIQIHNLTAQDDVDMIFTGFERPSPSNTWIGALAGLLDLRDGTNRTGTNPKHEALVHHIGITGHYNSAALMYAIRRDEMRILDTMLVALNPSDLNFFCHRYNAVPVAAAAGMGVVAMKVFADGSYYGEPPTFNRTPENVYQQVGSRDLRSHSLIRYALSIPGVSLCLTGIGHIAHDERQCQLASNLAAAQIITPIPEDEQRALEERLVSLNVSEVNNYFQRSSIGLTAPRNVGVESDTAGFAPSTPQPRPAVRITWDTAYAGRFPIVRYEVLRDGAVIGTVPHSPQFEQQGFSYEDVLDSTSLLHQPSPKPAPSRPLKTQHKWTAQRTARDLTVHEAKIHKLKYVVRSVDASGGTADSVALSP